MITGPPRRENKSLQVGDGSLSSSVLPSKSKVQSNEKHTGEDKPQNIIEVAVVKNNELASELSIEKNLSVVSKKRVDTILIDPVVSKSENLSSGRALKEVGVNTTVLSAVSSESGKDFDASLATPDNSCEDNAAFGSIDTICFPISDNSNISVGIGGLQFPALVDTGASVTAISANVWDKYLSQTSLCLDSSSVSCITSVNGLPLVTLGKVWLNFSIESEVFPFEIYVIKDLTHDVVIGRDFLQKYCSKIDFIEKIVQFSEPDDPLPFPNGCDDDRNDKVANDDNCVCSVHAEYSFTIPAQSEVVVVGKLSLVSEGVINQPSEIYGLVTPNSDLPHRYSVFGASELVKVSSHGTIPVRIVNPSSQPVKIYRRTKLADFEQIENDLATFEICDERQSNMCEVKTGPSASGCQRQPQDDYSEFPDLSDSVLNEDEKVKFRNLFKKYRDVFAFPGDQLGRTSLVQHVIETGDAMPIKQRPYRASPETKKEIDRQVDEMLESGIIQESVSPWSSPVVLVKKKDGTLRFCVDFRKLNKVTKMDSFPMPLVADALDSLAGTNVFSTLDLKSGFWQIEMHPNSREKTAFVTHNGLYEFVTMPFGLSNSGASFQRLMGHILRGLEYRFALIYIDDIIIFSKSIDRHLVHLEEVFRRLRDANVKLNPKKCSFVKRRVEYLGHVVTPEGVSPNPDKIRVVEEFPTPKNVKELRSFLGLANYYRRFVRGFSNVASPLNSLTKKGVPFVWTEACAVAFDKLKRALVNAPILAYPNFEEQFLLFVDANSTGIGFTLGQMQDGKEVVIAYNGRGLNQAEQNYSTTEREALALVEGIKKFQPYLHNHKFTVVTDHSSLRWLMNIKDATGRLARWALLLQQYSFDIVHRPGKIHGNADCLSRRPYDSCELSSFQKEDPQIAKTRELQRRDPEISAMIDFLESDILPSNDKAARKILLTSDNFYVGQDGLLYHLNFDLKRSARESFSQLVVPASLRFEILSNVHDHVAGAHFGVHKTFNKVKRRYWWKGMFKDVEHWCKSCTECSMRKSPRNSKKAPLLPIPVENAFDRVAVDVLGPFPPSHKGNRYIVVFSDYLTRWVEAFPVPSVEATVIARLLIDEIIARHGAPRVLLSDRGTNFLSKIVSEVCKIFQIHKVNTSSYHRRQMDL